MNICAPEPGLIFFDAACIIRLFTPVTVVVKCACRQPRSGRGRESGEEKRFWFIAPVAPVGGAESHLSGADIWSIYPQPSLEWCRYCLPLCVARLFGLFSVLLSCSWLRYTAMLFAYTVGGSVPGASPPVLINYFVLCCVYI